MFFSFQENDFVLHLRYGIGRFIGLELIDLNGTCVDFLKIQYQNDEFLFIPIYNIFVLKFHSDKNSSTVLDNFNSPTVFKKLNKVKLEIEKTANDLIQFALKRQNLIAFSLQKSVFFDDFCNDFGYHLTKSQDIALKEILLDLKKTIPMDRLLCADVGFGKTEVAARAIAYTLFNDKKALFVVPTSILALQHYNLLKDRFQKYEKSCVLLSKLGMDTDNVKKLWRLGKIDFLIATIHHKSIDSLLIDDLGIIVLDEEQHFGVKVKEKIRQHSHFLQLSATPIPRTLHLALSNIKDISMLTEPPYNKLRTEVFVEDLQNINLKKIIEEEILNKGKVFLVVPRVAQISEVSEILDKFKFKYVILHGKMDKIRINEALDLFLYNDLNIMICTNIIESGINISCVNLMIVFHAYMFGVSQLYQLKGRIGRSEKKSRIYFIVPKVLKDISVDRLNLIKENSDISDGFKLSIQDMENRGSGTVVGYRQSGNDYGFGLQMYYELLSEALGRKEVKKEVNEIIFVNFSRAYLPIEYICDIKMRLEFYRKLSLVKGYEELDLIVEDLKRFGDYPLEVCNFIEIVRINLLSRYFLIKKVVKKGEFFDISILDIDDYIHSIICKNFVVNGNVIINFSFNKFYEIKGDFELYLTKKNE